MGGEVLGNDLAYWRVLVSGGVDREREGKVIVLLLLEWIIQIRLFSCNLN